MGHAAMHFHTKPGNVGEAQRVVWIRENRFAQIAADLCHVDIKRSAELNVPGTISAKINVHQSRNKPGLASCAVEFNSLDK
jgi:hypothetical protein